MEESAWVKAVEDRLLLLRRDADPAYRVPKSEARCQRGRDGSAVHRHQDLAALGKFHCVANQVDQNLADPPGIAHHRVGQGRSHLARQLQTLLMGAQRRHFNRLLHQFAGLEFDRIEFEFTGLHFGKIEDIVDHRKQRIRRNLDGA